MEVENLQLKINELELQNMEDRANFDATMCEREKSFKKQIEKLEKRIRALETVNAEYRAKYEEEKREWAEKYVESLQFIPPPPPSTSNNANQRYIQPSTVQPCDYTYIDQDNPIHGQIFQPRPSIRPSGQLYHHAQPCSIIHQPTAQTYGHQSQKRPQTYNHPNDNNQSNVQRCAQSCDIFAGTFYQTHTQNSRNSQELSRGTFRPYRRTNAGNRRQNYGNGKEPATNDQDSAKLLLRVLDMIQKK